MTEAERELLVGLADSMTDVLHYFRLLHGPLKDSHPQDPSDVKHMDEMLAAAESQLNGLMDLVIAEQEGAPDAGTAEEDGR